MAGSGSLQPSTIRRPRQSSRHQRSIPIAVIGATLIGDAKSAADRVRSQEYRVGGSDIDLLSDFDCIVDFNAEVARGTFDLRMSERLGFILRVSYLIESQASAARRWVLAAVKRSSFRRKKPDQLP
jgi:hypothetical protein